MESFPLSLLAGNGEFPAELVGGKWRGRASAPLDARDSPGACKACEERVKGGGGSAPHRAPSLN
eukprot:scaffold19764_cov114-Isochrysis_galbana.AAC.6